MKNRLIQSCVLVWTLTSFAHAQELPQLGADDLMFSIENMDLTVDPAEDFARFAAGGWLDRVDRPEQFPAYNFPTIQTERIKAQTRELLAKVVEESPTAPKGSLTQLVGDFYRAYTDIKNRDAQGMAPLKDEIERIAAISSLDDLASYLGHLQYVSGRGVLIAFGVQGDLADSTKYSVFAGPGALSMGSARDLYDPEQDTPRREAYRTYVQDILVVAGYESDVASRMADTVLEIEAEMSAHMLSEADKRDFNKLNNRRTLAEVQADIPNLNLQLVIEGLGLGQVENVIQTDVAYYLALSKMLDERPLDDFKDYVAYQLISAFAGVLSSSFDEPQRAINQAFTGAVELEPLEDRALEELKSSLGHPISQLYVEATFDENVRDAVGEMIKDFLAVFKERVQTRDWLSDQTKEEALAKLAAFSVAVGYPDGEWVDYSTVDIVPDDPVANHKALVAFQWDRLFARMDGPVERDKFFGDSTLPIAMNAAYDFNLNGFEITAAVAQPPAYQADAYPAVRYCGFGGVIGHETIHGFDSAGRQFDADGNLRDWWTEEDGKAFQVEAQKLIDQVNSTEIVEGYTGNGPLWVPENMADVGGITLAHGALKKYLAEHPDEDVEVAGFSQEQLCFIAWAQLWAEKATDEYLIDVATSQNHPPNIYRTTAALQHHDRFYELFEIKEGDAMWLQPEKRVKAW